MVFNAGECVLKQQKGAELTVPCLFDYKFRPNLDASSLARTRSFLIGSRISRPIKDVPLPGSLSSADFPDGKPTAWPPKSQYIRFKYK